MPRKVQSPPTPVVLVPGLFASWNWGVLFDREPDDPNWTWALPGLPAAGNTWQTLIQALEHAGYVKDRDYFICFYDWRAQNDWLAPQASGERAPSSYLIDTLDHAWQAWHRAYPQQPRSAFRVTLIAHSLGGLVARSYAQSPAFLTRNDVGHIIELGSPNAGAVDTYYVWEGGELTPNYNNGVGGAFLDIYLWYERWLNGLSDNYATLHSRAPFASNLLPTGFDYVRTVSNTIKPTNSLAFTNTLLSARIPAASAAATLRARNITVDTIVGSGLHTDRWITVSTQTGPSPRYPDGRPMTLETSGDGDGTVLVESASLPGVSPIRVAYARHADLPQNAAAQVIALLGLPAGASLSALEAQRLAELPALPQPDKAAQTPQQAIVILGSPGITIEVRNARGDIVGQPFSDPWGEVPAWIVTHPTAERHVVRLVGKPGAAFEVEALAATEQNVLRLPVKGILPGSGEIHQNLTVTQQGTILPDFGTPP